MRPRRGQRSGEAGSVGGPLTPYLSLAIWVPIVAGVAVLVVGRDREASFARWIAFAGALAGFLVTIPLWANFDTTTSAMQFVEMADWIPRFDIHYHLGVDGISMLFVLLNSFITVLVVWAGWEVITVRVAQYMAAFLIMSGLMNAVFAALDGILFYLVFEAMLIPMYLIIGVWGGPNRVYAAVKFFLYTLLGSLLMLVALIYLYSVSESFEILEWYNVPLAMPAQILLFVAFFLAFAVKVPMWPVHTWLPDAHVEAPTGGSVILAAIMLKMGGYGFLRFSLPITPDASRELDWLVITLSLVAVAYIGLVALAQRDMKKLIAYSSIAHMGFVTLGAFVAWDILAATGSFEGAGMGLDGAMVQMVSHGLVSGALFFCVGVLYDRLHTRDISAYGGVVNTMPVFGFFAVLFAMANAGLPGTSGFVGEFLVIIASFKANFWYAFVAALTLILGAAYTLWLVKRVVWGEVANDGVASLKDLNAREFIVLATLAIAVLALGVWPAPLLDVMRPTIEQLVGQLMASKL